MSTLFATSMKNNIINMLTARTSNIGIGTAYLGLSSTAPSISGDNIVGITEPSSAQGYERKLIGNYSQSATQAMGSASGGSSTNTAEIHFNQAKEASEGGTGWGTLTHYALYSTATGGNPILAGDLSTSISVSAGAVVIIKIGELTVEFEQA